MGGVAMTITTEQIVEAGRDAITSCRWDHTLAHASNGGPLWTDSDLAQAAYDAMLPLIRKQLADEVRGDCAPEVIGVHEGYGEEVWCPKHREHWPCGNESVARLIEGVEG